MKATYDELFFSRTHDFLDVYLAKQINRSKQTARSYRYALLIFYNFISDSKKMNPMKFLFSDCTHDLILEYAEYLKEELNYKSSSVNQRIAALKAYAKYVSDDDMSLIQMRVGIASVPLQKVPKLQRPVISRDALKDMLDIPDTSKFSIRDRTMLILLFDTAMRVGELINLKIGDLHIESANPYIYAFGKGNKERVIGLSEKTVDHLEQYLSNFHIDADNAKAPLFYTVIKGNITTMSARNVERIVDKYAGRVARSDMPESVYPHMLRRTRATGLYQDGVPLEMISRILGHRYMDTTKIYASPSVEQLREVLERNSNEEPEPVLWTGKTDEIAKKFGLK